MMRAVLAGLVSAAVLAAACGGGSTGGGSSSPTSPTGSTLIGTWNATKAEYVSRSNSSVRVDVVAKGTVMTLVLASGSFTLTIKDPGTQGNVLTGTWTASTDILKMTQTGMSRSWEFDMTLSGNTLTLNNGGAEFDVNSDGVAEQAVLNLVMTRP